MNISILLPTGKAKFEPVGYVAGISLFVISETFGDRGLFGWVGIKRHPVIDAYAGMATWDLIRHHAYGEMWVVENTVELMNFLATLGKLLDRLQLFLARVNPRHYPPAPPSQPALLNASEPPLE